MTVTKVALNEPLSADRFALEVPQGTEVVHLTDSAEEKKP
jgi:hypothetical protein